MKIVLSETREIPIGSLISLYSANKWSSADKPDLLHKALVNSHSLISAWEDGRLVGIGNAISDGHLVVYYPHLLVHPDYQGKGIGQLIMARMQEKYRHFHMQLLTADGRAVDFYAKVGFKKAGNTVPMWIYDGDEH